MNTHDPSLPCRCERRLEESSEEEARLQMALSDMEARAEEADKARQTVEAALWYLAERYGALLRVHEQVVMDTPEDRELHANAVAAFKEAIRLSTFMAGVESHRNHG